ncbi:MAG: response regulator transcription factor [Dehalococcoidia bacterium]
MADPLRVAVLSTYPTVRAGLRALLSELDGIEVMAELSPAAVMAGGFAGEIDALVVDIEDDGESLGVADDLFAELPTVLLGSSAEAEAPYGHYRAGRGFLPRDASAEEIGAAALAAAQGLVVMHPSLAAPTLGRQPMADGSDRLTDRELDVLRLLALGLPNKGIAHRLGISEHTVKFHVGAILSRLGAASRTEAVMLGARKGLLPL